MPTIVTVTKKEIACDTAFVQVEKKGGDIYLNVITGGNQQTTYVFNQRTEVTSLINCLEKVVDFMDEQTEETNY